MMSPPTMAPGTEVKPPRISTGKALSAIKERLNCTPLLAPHMMPATMATRPATDQTTTQMVLSGIPMESAASWSSATARSARPTCHHEGGVRDPDVQLLDVASPEQLAEALEEEVQSDGGHEQDDVLLVHERS